MKKLYLLVLGFVASSVVHAQTVSIGYQDQRGVKGTSDSAFTVLSIRDKIADNWFGDVVFNQVQVDTGKSVSTRLEGGLTYNHKLTNNLTGSFRTAIGQRHRAAGTGNHLYYSVEPGISYRIDKVTMGIGYRYRDSFNEIDNDKTRTVRMRVGYDLTKKDTVFVTSDIARGVGPVNTLGLAYSRRF